MSLRIKKGNLLEEKVDAIVNTVNCVGVMGKGIALQFKQRWPENFKEYEKACKADKIKPGKMFVFELGELAGQPYYIINFPTKKHWREKSKLSYIEDGLKDLAKVITVHNIKSISIPPLGCGNGGLPWSQVQNLITNGLAKFNNQLDVNLFEPGGAPKADSLVIKTKKPNMTPGRAVLIKLIATYREIEYVMSKLEIQKLCYFAQEAGEPLRLKFEKNKYGPYADNLRHVLNALNEHYITGVGDHDTIEAEIKLRPEAIFQAEKFLDDYPDSLKNLSRVSELVEGFESPYGMELLSTVYWIAKEQKESSSLNSVTTGVYNWEPSEPSWNRRKQTIIQEEHIRIALEHLQVKNWIH